MLRQLALLWLLAGCEDIDTDGPDTGSGDSDTDRLDSEVDTDVSDTSEDTDDTANGDTDGDGISDAHEVLLGTDPTKADTDGDGLNDGDEVNRRTNPLVQDTDGDGLNDGDEVSRGTNPLKADTDGDGLDDKAEVDGVTNPLEADSDFDGLSDKEELEGGTDPVDADSDDDGLNDGAELARDTDPLKADTDGDGLKDGDEVHDHRSDPLLEDTDGDGLKDGDEVNAHGTDPTLDDTDGDGLSDPDELDLGTDPTLEDTDDDGLLDGEELDLDTNPLLEDTDGDGLKDGDEVELGADPLLEDTDGDGLTDGPEVHEHGTDPTLADTDGGGRDDAWELEKGRDPTDPADDDLAPILALDGPGRAGAGDALAWDASASADPDGEPLEVSWEVVSGDPDAFEPDGDTLVARFDTPGVYVIRVRIDDGTSATEQEFEVVVLERVDEAAVVFHAPLFGDTERANTAAIDGELAVVGNASGGLALLDISEPALPVRVDAAPGNVTIALALQGTMALRASAGPLFNSNLTFVDFSERDNPVVGAPLASPVGIVAGMASGPPGYFLVAGANGLGVVRAEGVTVTPVASLTGIGQVRAVKAFGDHAVVALVNGATWTWRLVDLTDPTAPALRGGGGGGTNALALTLWEQAGAPFVGVCDGLNSLDRFDLTDLDAPVAAGVGVPVGCHDLAWADDHLYALDTRVGARVWSDPTGTPQRVGTLIPEGTRLVGVSNGHLWTSNIRLAAVRTDRMAERFIQPQTASFPELRGIAAWGDRLYGIDWLDGVRVWDVEDPSTPVASAHLLPGQGAFGLAASEGRVAAAMASTVAILEEESTGGASHLGTWAPGNMVPSKLGLAGDRLWVADYPNRKAHLVDLLDPSAPRLTSTLTGPQPAAAVVSDTLALVRPQTNNTGTFIWDVSDIDNPAAIAGGAPIPLPGGDLYPALDGEALYTVAHAIIAQDLAAPEAPVGGAGVPLPSTGLSLGYHAGRAAAGDDYRGLRMADFADAYTGELAGHFNHPGRALGVAVTPSTVWTLNDSRRVWAAPNVPAGTLEIVEGEPIAGAELRLQASFALDPAWGLDGAVCLAPVGTCEVTDLNASAGEVGLRWSLPEIVGDLGVTVLAGSGDYWIAANARVAVQAE